MFLGKGHIAGLYLYMPKHPMSNPSHGMKHLGGMPSPRFFSTLPKYSFWDDRFKGFNKGWTDILRYLTSLRFAGRPVISRQEAMEEFGDFYSYRAKPKRVEKTWAGKQRLKEKYPTYNSSDYDKVMKDLQQTAEYGMKLRTA